MSVLVDQNTCVLVQGITGKQGRCHALKMRDYGMQVLAGVSPGKGGEDVEGIPVFNSVREAKQAFPQINATMIMVPPKGVLSSAMEAVDSDISLIVVITEFVPVMDALKFVNAAKAKNLTVIGPNTIGLISPGKGKVGVMPEYIYKPGHIGVISRSGTLTHEMSSNMTFAGYGQTTCIGIGGDPIIGLNHTEALELFRDDEDTMAVVIIGEIGGSGEEDAADYIKRTAYPKPVFAYIAGSMAPEGAKMGHAGAIVSQGTGTAKSKIESLTAAGVTVGETTGRVLEAIKELDLKMGGILKTAEPISDTDI